MKSNDSMRSNGKWWVVLRAAVLGQREGKEREGRDRLTE